jgi:undecaprenyl-diphosphatase
MIRSVILGAVQGVTEFLPISSSGHLVLFQRFVGLDPPGVLLEALLHWGTLAAVVFVFRSDLMSLARSLTARGTLEGRKEIGLLVAGSIPIAVAGLLLRSSMGGLFASSPLLGASFLVTGLILGLTRIVRRRAERNQAHFTDAIFVGLAQAAALLPGLSRSGVTISTGLFAGLTPGRAARFSFCYRFPRWQLRAPSICGTRFALAPQRRRGSGSPWGRSRHSWSGSWRSEHCWRSSRQAAFGCSRSTASRSELSFS